MPKQEGIVWLNLLWTWYDVIVLPGMDSKLDGVGGLLGWCKKWMEYQDMKSAAFYSHHF